MRLHHAKEIEIEQKRIIRFNFFFPFSLCGNLLWGGGGRREKRISVSSFVVFSPRFSFFFFFCILLFFYEEHAQGMPFACKSSMSPRH